jgi:hypothetical protein
MRGRLFVDIRPVARGYVAEFADMDGRGSSDELAAVDLADMRQAVEAEVARWLAVIFAALEAA